MNRPQGVRPSDRKALLPRLTTLVSTFLDDRGLKPKGSLYGCSVPGISICALDAGRTRAGRNGSRRAVPSDESTACDRRMGVVDNRKKALELAVLGIEKQYGMGVIMRLDGDGKDASRPVAGVISSGFISLDIAL